MGANVVVDNRTGATSDIIATDIVAKSATDGYTLRHLRAVVRD